MDWLTNCRGLWLENNVFPSAAHRTKPEITIFLILETLACVEFSEHKYVHSKVSERRKLYLLKRFRWFLQWQQEIGSVTFD